MTVIFCSNLGAAEPILHFTIFQIFGEILEKYPFFLVELTALTTYLEIFLNFLELIRCIDLVSQNLQFKVFYITLSKEDVTQTTDSPSQKILSMEQFINYTL